MKRGVLRRINCKESFWVLWPGGHTRLTIYCARQSVVRHPRNGFLARTLKGEVDLGADIGFGRLCSSPAGGWSRGEYTRCVWRRAWRQCNGGDCN